MVVHFARPGYRELLAGAALLCVPSCARSPLEAFEGDAAGPAQVPSNGAATDPNGAPAIVRVTDAGSASDPVRARDAGARDSGHVDHPAEQPVDASEPPAPGEGTQHGDSSVPSSPDAGGSPVAPDAPDAASASLTTPGPAPAVPDAGTVAPAPTTDLCKLNAYDVAILGDSFMRLSGDFTRFLQNKARASGVLGTNDTYVDSSQTFASMNGSPGIPGQYTTAVAESKRRGGTGPKLVIMTGGGQDVLIDNRTCLNPKSVDEVAHNAACVGVVDKVLSTAQRLIDTGVASGSRAAIYFFYPNLPENSLAGGANGNNVLNYAAPRAKAFCEGQTKAPCYFIDMRPPFEDANNLGHPRDGLIGFDGVNPTALGSQILADEVWKVMEAKCLGVKK